MASQVQIPFEGVILQEHSAPISCPTPNFTKGSFNHSLFEIFLFSRNLDEPGNGVGWRQVP